jgi:regulatory protein YycH of two-component signal transduction system YycFG
MIPIRIFVKEFDWNEYILKLISFNLIDHMANPREDPIYQKYACNH